MKDKANPQQLEAVSASTDTSVGRDSIGPNVKLTRSVCKIRNVRLFVAIALLAQVCQAATPDVGRYRVKAAASDESPISATIRTTPHGFYIGRMNHETGSVFIKEPHRTWSWAYHSGAQLCGWILNGRLGAKLATTQLGSCESAYNEHGVPHRRHLLAHYASEINDYNPGVLKKWGKHIALNPGEWPVYGNVFKSDSSLELRDQITTIDGSQYVCWRYIVKGSENGIVLISYASAKPKDGKPRATWGFIRMEAINRVKKPESENSRASSKEYEGGPYPKNEKGIRVQLPHHLQ